ncbi:MAG: extracellular solute-binding protein [Chloroflexota bacterium]|nr:extracellular solute-binding protein [Chloroflexota bacterium]
MKRVVLFLLALMLLTLSVNTLFAQDSLTIWTKYNSESPQNIQDEWMAALIEEYAADTGVAIDNVTRPFDTINTDLNSAVLAGGEIPDLSYMDTPFLSRYFINGTLTDLTEFVTNASWFEDLSPTALAACTAPDGTILCVPTVSQGTLSYYWTAAFPDGFDGSTDALMGNVTTEYRLTGKNTEQFGFEVFFYPLMASYGAVLADAEGNATWASPESVAAIEFLRELHANGDIPDTSLAAGFDFENAFKDGTAGMFVAGSWSYVFLNPLTSPDGVEFPADSTAVSTALEAGALAFAPPLHLTGSTPVSFINVNGWAIPSGSANVEAALAFIDWHMTSARNSAYAASYGGLPTLVSGLETEAFQTPYWTGVSEILNTYGAPPPAFFDYSAGATKIANTITALLLDPELDILTELQTAQDEYNADVAAQR